MTQTDTAPSPRFIQIHFLASYPGALLNRDDAGLAKRLPYGGAVRVRVSSQCLKRHWRMADDPRAIHRMAEEAGAAAKRSKETVERLVIAPLRENGGLDAELVDAIEEEFVKGVYGSKAGDKKSRQALLLGRPEIDHLRALAEGIAREADDAKDAKEKAGALFKEDKANFAALRAQNALAPGLESALFGRLVTSDPRANTDAAIHVAHAFTEHEGEFEQDYFTVVDDLTKLSEENEEGGTGAAGVFDTELATGLYYGYVVVDVPLLVSNLAGVHRSEWDAAGTDRDLAARTVENLVHLIATVSPGAKKGSTAPYAWADAVLVEAGDRQPRTLARAFQTPVPLGNGELAGRTGAALRDELADLDDMYGPGEARWLAAREAIAFDGPERMTLAALAARAGRAVRDARL
ncbi:MAG: type I-E CRISPR-associated protein Cas7/Cse4/CasC [Myxococcota bacterium]